MSFEGDAPMRTLCDVCEKWCETEGHGVSPTVMDADGTVRHARCAPELCQHERRTVRDWKETAPGMFTNYCKCRDCGEFFEEEAVSGAERREWMRLTNDMLLQKGVSRLGVREALGAYNRGLLPHEFVNEVIGSLVRAGEME